jgi:hypothetical protein
LRYSCGHVSTKKNVRGIKDAATSTPPQLRSSRYIRYRDNIGYPRYGERYDIGDNQYSSNNLSYCPINRFLESITNLSRIVAKLPQSRLVGHHYPTTDPARVATKGQGGSKVGRGQCSVCLRFWGFDRRVTTICGECKVHLCCDGCFLQWHQKEPDWDATFVGWGLNYIICSPGCA